MNNEDLSYSIKEVVEELKDEMKEGFHKQEIRFDNIEKRFDAMGEIYARKSSVAKLWAIAWGAISLVFASLTTYAINLILHHNR